jgi:hypothetical protein
VGHSERALDMIAAAKKLGGDDCRMSISERM